MSSRKNNMFKKIIAILTIAGAGIVATVIGQKCATEDSEPTNQPKIIVNSEDDKKQQKQEVPPLVGDSDDDKNKKKWKMGKTTFRYTPEPLSPEKLKKVEQKEREILAEMGKYTKNMRDKTFSLSPVINIKDEIIPTIWPPFMAQVFFTETFFYDGGPDLSGYYTSGPGGTYMTRDRAFPNYTDDGQKIIDPKKEFKKTIRLFWDHGKRARKVTRKTPMRYSHIKNITSGNTSGDYELKTYDFTHSLSYEQKWRQAKLFLSFPGEPLMFELTTVRDENKRNNEPNEITPQLTLSLLSPFWQRPENGQAIEFRLSDFEPTNEAFASTYKNKKVLKGALKRLFWAYCESRGYLTPEMYLQLQSDGISALLDDYVKQSLNIDREPTIKDYVKAGVFERYGQPYQHKNVASTERYYFTKNKNKIDQILNYALEHSKELQDNGERNTILRQMATDLVENGMSAEDLFTTNDYDDTLTPYQEILFERADIYYSSVTSVTRIQNLINGAKYEQEHTDDEQIKHNLEQIILEEKIHLTQIKIDKSKGSEKNKYKEQLDQEINDLNKFFNKKDKQTEKTDKNDTKTVQTNPHKDANIKALQTNARKDLDDGRYDDAIKKYNEIIAQDKNNTEAYSDLALAHIKYAKNNKSMAEQKKHYEAACKAVRLGLRTNPDNNTKAHLYYNAGSAREELGKIASNNGEVNNARDQLNRAKTNYQEADKAIPSSTYKQAVSRIDNLLKDLKGKKQKEQKNKKSKKTSFNESIEEIETLIANKNSTLLQKANTYIR